MVSISVLLVVGIFEVCRAQLSASDYIIDVTPACPDTATPGGAATITILTDLPSTEPYALCDDDLDFLFEQQNDGTWTLDAHFPDPSLDTSKTCVFTKQPSTEVYLIKAIVPLSAGLVTVDTPGHIVVCNYDQVGIHDTGSSTFEDSANPVDEVQEHLAEVSASNVVLCPANVLRNCITGRIQLGKTIMLKAELIVNASDEQSFQALSCKAVGVRSEYAILLGGCGDGVVIPKNRGFITQGTTAYSPYFKSFRLPGSRTVSFQCSFIVCASDCDGTSCEESTKRRKRDTNQISQLQSDEGGDECKCAVSIYASLATGTLSMVLTGVLTYVLMRNRRKKQNYQQTKTRQRFQEGILENKLTIISSLQYGYRDSDLDPYSYIDSECGKDSDIYLEPIT